MEQGVILIIDDDVDFCTLVQAAFEQNRIANPVQTINDGQAALIHLKQLTANRSTSVGLPKLILLDWRMPGVSGLEVLRLVRHEPRLAGLPVIVLTGIDADGEASRALELGATAFHVKPFFYEELVHLAREIRDDYLLPKPLPKAA